MELEWGRILILFRPQCEGTKDLRPGEGYDVIRVFCLENGDKEAREEAGTQVKMQLHLHKWEGDCGRSDEKQMDPECILKATQTELVDGVRSGGWGFRKKSEG